MYDKSDFNGTELRAFAGNFLWSTGANEVAGRFCRGHFDLPMRSCSVFLDDNPVVESGKLIKELTWYELKWFLRIGVLFHLSDVTLVFPKF